MNPHASLPAGPSGLIRSLLSHRRLIVALIRREVIGRYRGSILGLAWSFFNPLLMLAIYTFVFSFVFKARWGTTGTSRAEFALILFAGLTIHTLFSECIMRAPGIIPANANYVKKVVFPLEILCWINLGSALFHALISIGILLVALLFVTHGLHWTIVLMPLILLPYMLGIMGVSWALAALGVFMKDINQAIGALLTVLMFMTPIFYPVTAIPEQYRFWIYMNPLTWVVEQFRNVIVFGVVPSAYQWMLSLAIGCALGTAGFWLFQKLRKGFADVL